MKDKLLGQNENLRKAMVRALNRDEMIKLFLNCRGVKATSIVPPVIAGHVAREKLEGDFNVEEAKKYLAKAGFPGGKDSPDQVRPPRSRHLCSPASRVCCQEHGRNRCADRSGGQHLPRLSREREKRGICSFSLVVGTPTTLTRKISCSFSTGKNVSPGPNASNWVNGEFDRLYEKLAQMSPSAERSAMIKRAEDIAFNDAVWSMLYYPIRFCHGW